MSAAASPRSWPDRPRGYRTQRDQHRLDEFLGRLLTMIGCNSQIGGLDEATPYPHPCRCPRRQSIAPHRSCDPLVEYYAVTRDVAAETVWIVSLRLEHATTAGHRVDRQLRHSCRAPERRGCCDARRCIVGQDDEQVPVAGMVSVVASTVAEQENPLWLHLSNDTPYRRLEPRVRGGHDRTDRR